MRKLRKAAVVAVMVGSASVLGVGAASAHEEGGNTQTIVCDQSVDNSSTTTQNGLINLADTPISLLSSGNATSTPTQQVCGNENSHNANVGLARTGGRNGIGELELGGLGL